MARFLVQAIIFIQPQKIKKLLPKSLNLKNTANSAVSILFIGRANKRSF
jgi:hypothetical protein